jgi:hypothetical protein
VGAWNLLFETFCCKNLNRQKIKPAALLRSATGYAVKNRWWLAYPLLPPANGLSVALQ